MAIKAPNYHDIVERPWVERAVGAAAATVFAAGVTAAFTVGAAEIAPTLSAPAPAGSTPTATRTVDLTGSVPASYLDIPSARRPAAATTTRSRATAIGQSATAPATESAPKTGGGGVKGPSPRPPVLPDPPASHSPEQDGVYVGGALGDVSIAIGAGPDGVGATTGDTTVGSPPAAPPSDGVTISAAPGQGLAPIVVVIP